MKDSSIAVRLPSHDEFIAPVTIRDGQGGVVRVVPAAEFRRLHPSSSTPARSYGGAARAAPGRATAAGLNERRVGAR